MREHPDSVFCLNTFKDGDWTEANFSKQPFAKLLKFHFNPEASLENSEELETFAADVMKRVGVLPLSSLLPQSGIVGNIRFSNPTVYIFPSQQGNCALFGISGFTMLLDGGFSHNSCFWPFVRHLDQVDALLVSHLAENNLFGISSALKRKDLGLLHPEIRCMLHNGIEKAKLGESKDTLSSAKSALVVDVISENHRMMECAANLGVPVSPCVGKLTGASLQPINLYHKIGHGSLDLFVLNPLHDSKDLKDYVAALKKPAGCIPTKGDTSLSSLACASVVLVWKPASSSERIMRLFFPGSAPVARLFEGLDKLKSSPLFQQRVQGEQPKKSGASRLKQGLSSSKSSLSSRTSLDVSRSGASAKPPNKPGVGTKASARDVKKPTVVKKNTSPRDNSGDGKLFKSPLPVPTPVAESSPIVKESIASTDSSPVTPEDASSPVTAANGDGSSESASKPEVVATENGANGEEGTANGDTAEVPAAMAPEDVPDEQPVAEGGEQSEAAAAVEPVATDADANASGDGERAPADAEAPPADVEQVKVEITESAEAAPENSEEQKTNGKVEAGKEESMEKEKKANGVDEKDIDTTAVSSPEAEAKQSVENNEVKKESSASPAKSPNKNGTAEASKPSKTTPTSAKKPASTKKVTSVVKKTPRPKTAPASALAKTGAGDTKRPTTAAAVQATKPPVKKAFSSTSTAVKKAPLSTLRKPPVGKEASSSKPEARKTGLDVSMRGKKESSAPNSARKPLASARSDLNTSKRANASMNESVRLNTSVMAGSGSARAPRLAPVTPFFVELAYIPCNGTKAVKLDFFRRVRAQFYVLSSLRPSGDVIDLLLEAKKTWGESSTPVTVIPTYDTEDFCVWMRDNRERLDDAGVQVEPSVNRCVIHLQGHDASCAAYRLEFDGTLSHNAF